MTHHTDHIRIVPLDVPGDPVGALCRRMVAEGLSGSLTVGDTSNVGRLIFHVRSIEARAKRTVREDDRRGPHYAKWKPSPFSKEAQCSARSD